MRPICLLLAYVLVGASPAHATDPNVGACVAALERVRHGDVGSANGITEPCKAVFQDAAFRECWVGLNNVGLEGKGRVMAECGASRYCGRTKSDDLGLCGPGADPGQKMEPAMVDREWRVLLRRIVELDLNSEGAARVWSAFDAAWEALFPIPKPLDYGPEGVVARGGVPRAAVVALLAPLAEKARACLGNDRAGEVHFLIIVSGKLGGLDVAKGPAALGPCAKRLLDDVVFPKSKGGGVTIVNWMIR